jgi:hypothetical protein
MAQRSPAFVYVLKSSRIPRIGTTDGQGYAAIAHIKLFTPTSNWTWYLTEYDPDTNTAFGLVDGFEEELGYVDLTELRECPGPYGLYVERDLHWEPRPLSECRRKKK